MALRSMIFKAQVDISDMDRGYYDTHSLVLAQHPSETSERVMLRLAAFCFAASPTLRFGPGLSNEDEPALYDLDDAGDINSWIEVGQPDVHAVKKALSKSRRVLIFSSGQARTQAWWDKCGRELLATGRVQAWTLADGTLEALTPMLSKMMRLSAAIQDGVLWLSSDADSVEVAFLPLEA